MPTHMREFFSKERVKTGKAGFASTISPINLPVLRMPTQTDQNSALEGGFLFHLTEDPEQNVNLIHALPQRKKSG